MNKLKITLGKIQQNKLLSLIREIEWKGKSTKTLSTYLDYKTNEPIHDSVISTDVFGDIDKEVLLFLECVYKSHNLEVTESNYKIIMLELEAFNTSYNYKVVDNRKTKEQLIQQQNEREQYQKEQELKTKLEEEETHKAGLLTKSEKISLGTKEIAKRIREQLKTEFKECTFSVTMESYAGGSSITAALMAAPFNPVLSFDDLDLNEISHYLDGRTTEQLKDMLNKGYHQLGRLNDEYNKNVWSNGAFLSLEGYNLFKRVYEIINYYNYDDSEPQTDYFSVNFYSHVNIGRWDNKFKLVSPVINNEPAPVLTDKPLIKKNEDKNGIEIYFKQKPKVELLSSLKSNGFRWSNYNKCWYKKYTEEAEQIAIKIIGE